MTPNKDLDFKRFNIKETPVPFKIDYSKHPQDKNIGIKVKGSLTNKKTDSY